MPGESTAGKAPADSEGLAWRAMLKSWALAYVARYAAPESALRRMLVRRLRRRLLEQGAAANQPPLDAQIAALLPIVEDVINHHRRLGYVDDAAFATARLRSLRRRGNSGLGVRARLRQQGVAEAAINQALAEEAPGPAVEAELAACHQLARRRRLGPWRTAEARPAHRLRDLAILQRAGFPLAIAVMVIDDNTII